MASPFLPLLGVCAAAVVLAAGPATAQTCRDQVDRLAAALDLEPVPPTAGSTGPGAPTGDGAAGGAVTTDRLARSGGVVAPPVTGDGGVITPPPEAGAAMPTAPAVRPAPGETIGNDAARQAQVSALVMAARAAADEGDEARCLSTLRQLRTLMPRTTPNTGPGTGG
ncbi:hypothetical protein M2352_000842 [Azospirillum fermentarium]|uniref:hypothetical protein n=1 Tax=Azospirillum fermentarium TaxID=1233114 RepID=UPI002227BD7F|nr:hypothetical protein [Azospirillum fermentarium]MCW2245251.1 hypothetical protein [Azospirillum fermentarium]